MKSLDVGINLVTDGIPALCQVSDPIDGAVLRTTAMPLMECFILLAIGALL